MKYVVFIKNMKELAHLVPVIFPNSLVHEDMAMALLAGPLKGYEVDSAGEVSPLDMQCGGRSSSLNKDSKPERDSRLLLMADYGSMFE